jgi:heme/copper-type cytochrome/quinol oxidase subunit 1
MMTTGLDCDTKGYFTIATMLIGVSNGNKDI